MITSCRTTCKFLIKKNKKIQHFIDKTNLFLDTLLFSPWAILATWLHVGAPQKLQEN
jgi:hypothetical protein